MVSRQTYDFSDWTDLSTEECNGVNGFTNPSDPARATLDGLAKPATVYFTSAKFTQAIADATQHNIYARVKCSNLTPTHGYGIYIGNGTNYIMLLVLTLTGTNAIQAVNQTDGRCYTSGGSASNVNVTTVVNEWTWLKIYHDGEGNFYLSYNITNSSTKPTDWTAHTQIFSIGAFSINEVGIYAIRGGTPAANLDYDDLEIEEANTGSGNIGLNATIEIKSTYARLALGAQGAVKYELSSPHDADTTIIQAEIGNVVSVQNANEINIFKGEIKSYSNINPHSKVLEGVSQGNKLTKLTTQTNALNSGIRLIYDKLGVIYDQSKAYTVNEFQNKPIAFSRANLKEYHRFPHTAWFVKSDSETTFTPEDITGALTNVTLLYTGNDDGTPDNATYGIVARDDETANVQWGIRLSFLNYFRTGTTLSNIDAIFTVKFEPVTTNKSQYNSRAEADNHKIMIYNWTTTSWELCFSFNDYSNPNFPFVRTPGAARPWWDQANSFYLVQFDIRAYIMTGGGSTVINDYFDIGAENAAGFKRHTMRLSVHTNDFDFVDVVVSGHLGVYFARLDFKTEQEQYSEYGIENVASNTATTITLDDANLAGVTMPHEDGFSLGDDFFISEYITGLFASIVTNSGTSLSGSINATDSGTVIDMRDMTYDYMFDVLQLWAALLNSAWWIDPRDDTIYFISLDNIVDSGVTLTETDIVDYDDGAYSHAISGGNIRNKVIVVGASGLIKPVNTSPEFGLDGDDEQEVYVNPNLKTLNLVERFANKKKIIHENANREVRITLNYSKPPQDYSAIFLGKWVKVNIASTVEANYTSDTLNIPTGKLLVIAMEYNKGPNTGDMEYITLTLQRRYSA